MPLTLGFETDESGNPPYSYDDAYVMKRFISGYYLDAIEAPAAAPEEPVTTVESDALVENAQVPMDYSELASFGIDLSALEGITLPIDAPEAASPDLEAEAGADLGAGPAATGGIGGLLIRFLDAARAAEQSLIAALEAESAGSDEGSAPVDETAMFLPEGGSESFLSYGPPVEGPAGAVDQGADDALAFSAVVDGLETLVNFTLTPGDYVF